MQNVEKKSRHLTVFAACWATYVVTYLCRVNYSSAMLKLSQEMGISSSQLGTIGSVFFAIYAIGQLFNGWVGDKVSPYKFVSIAILGTAILNLGMSLSHEYSQLLVLWALNGYFQSMLWGPLMRILSQQFPPNRTMQVSTGMSTSMVIGYIISWAIFGRFFLPFPWWIYFLIPSVIALFTGALWVGSLRRNKTRQSVLNKEKVSGSLKKVLCTHRLWLVAFVCLCMGLIKESLSLWAPLLLKNMLGLENKDSLLIAIAIPLANFIGILVTGKLMHRKNNVKKTLLMLFTSAVCCAISLFLLYRMVPVVGVIAISTISGLMYGCNSLLLSYIPIHYGGETTVSSLVGLFDFSSYMGAALSSILLGFAIEAQNYYALFGIWAVVLATAGILTLLLKLDERR